MPVSTAFNGIAYTGFTPNTHRHTPLQGTSRAAGGRSSALPLTAPISQTVISAAGAETRVGAFDEGARRSGTCQAWILDRRHVLHFSTCGPVSHADLYSLEAPLCRG